MDRETGSREQEALNHAADMQLEHLVDSQMHEDLKLLTLDQITKEEKELWRIFYINVSRLVQAEAEPSLEELRSIMSKLKVVESELIRMSQQASGLLIEDTLPMGGSSVSPTKGKRPISSNPVLREERGRQRKTTMPYSGEQKDILGKFRRFLKNGLQLNMLLREYIDTKERSLGDGAKQLTGGIPEWSWDEFKQELMQGNFSSYITKKE